MYEDNTLGPVSAGNYAQWPLNNPDIGTISGTGGSTASTSSSTTASNKTSALTGGLVGSAVGVGAGLYQTLWANKQINKLNSQPAPNYEISPELQASYSEAQSNKNIGLTSEEKTAFQANLNRGSATNLYNATKMGGGNLATSLEGAVSSENLGAYDKLAATDADMRRQNLQQYYQMSGQMQNQKNLISQQKIQYREQQEQVYGQALQAGLSNLTKGLQGVGSAAAGLVLA